MRSRRMAFTMLRRIGVGLTAGVLAAAAMVPGVGAADPPVAWQASAGVATRNQAVQGNAFLPRDLTVNVNDTITWNVRSGEFHTVTFLSGAAAPPLITF